MARLVSVLVISICLMGPVSFVSAQDHDQGHDQGSSSMTHETHETTHEWNENEDKPWHEYLSEHHRTDHEWTKASKRATRIGTSIKAHALKSGERDSRLNRAPG